MDVEAPAADVSLWDEGQHWRCHASKEWILSGTFTDDLVAIQVMFSLSMPWLLRQLEESGSAWEEMQQHNFIMHGTRECQMARAYEGVHTQEFLANVSGLIWHEDAWMLLRHRNEEKQLQTFMLAARLGATGYDLVLARTRNYPYKAAAGVVNPALLKELASQCPRRLCPYAESVREHYKASLEGPAALS